MHQKRVSLADPVHRRQRHNLCCGVCSCFSFYAYMNHALIVMAVKLYDNTLEKAYMFTGIHLVIIELRRLYVCTMVPRHANAFCSTASLFLHVHTIVTTFVLVCPLQHAYSRCGSLMPGSRPCCRSCPHLPLLPCMHAASGSSCVTSVTWAWHLYHVTHAGAP